VITIEPSRRKKNEGIEIFGSEKKQRKKNRGCAAAAREKAGAPHAPKRAGEKKQGENWFFVTGEFKFAIQKKAEKKAAAKRNRSE